LTAKDWPDSPNILRGHEGRINAVAISPDNQCLVTGSNDGTVRLWDLTAEDRAANSVVLRGHENGISGVAVSADNRWVVTGSYDSTARLWLLKRNDLILLARVVAGRNLSSDEWNLYFPGEDYRKTFPDLPGPNEKPSE
jgi:WD40 repeat protein